MRRGAPSGTAVTAMRAAHLQLFDGPRSPAFPAGQAPAAAPHCRPLVPAVRPNRLAQGRRAERGVDRRLLAVDAPLPRSPTGRGGGFLRRRRARPAENGLLSCLCARGRRSRRRDQPCGGSWPRHLGRVRPACACKPQALAGKVAGGTERLCPHQPRRLRRVASRGAGRDGGARPRTCWCGGRAPAPVAADCARAGRAPDGAAARLDVSTARCRALHAHIARSHKFRT
jgi:hypothetical protein